MSQITRASLLALSTVLLLLPGAADARRRPAEPPRLGATTAGPARRAPAAPAPAATRSRVATVSRPARPATPATATSPTRTPRSAAPRAISPAPRSTRPAAPAAATTPARAAAPARPARPARPAAPSAARPARTRTDERAAPTAAEARRAREAREAQELEQARERRRLRQERELAEAQRARRERQARREQEEQAQLRRARERRAEREAALEAARQRRAARAPRPCLSPPVLLVRVHAGAHEPTRVSLTRCNGRVHPEGLRALSILGRPGDTPAPSDATVTAYERSLEAAARRAARPARRDAGRSEPTPDPDLVAPGIRRLHPRLALMLQRVVERFPNRAIEIVSGWRPRARASSRHHHARAIDFRIAGVSRETLRDFLRTFDRAGVGYYPNSVFVHLDVRDTRGYWIDRSGPGERPDYGRWPPSRGWVEARSRRIRERVGRALGVEAKPEERTRDDQQSNDDDDDLDEGSGDGSGATHAAATVSPAP